jgi:hypothetical protein
MCTEFWWESGYLDGQREGGGNMIHFVIRCEINFSCCRNVSSGGFGNNDVEMFEFYYKRITGSLYTWVKEKGMYFWVPWIIEVHFWIHL